MFDAAFARITDAGLGYWADPFHQHPGRINHDYGGRGVYFNDPTATTWKFRPSPTATHRPDDPRAGADP